MSEKVKISAVLLKQIRNVREREREKKKKKKSLADFETGGKTATAYIYSQIPLAKRAAELTAGPKNLPYFAAFSQPVSNTGRLFSLFIITPLALFRDGFSFNKSTSKNANRNKAVSHPSANAQTLERLNIAQLRIFDSSHFFAVCRKIAARDKHAHRRHTVI